MLIRENISLAEYTTLKIGGTARHFVAAESETDVAAALDFACKNNLETFILGGGSNVLISDAGFDGLVLQIALKGISVAEKDDEIVRVEAAAGEDWDTFVRFCVAENLAGVECLSGIPGFVGGTPVQNVGAYGQEVAETIAAVKVFDRAANQFKILTAVECGFAYRTSIFNTVAKDQFVVLSVVYELKRGGAPKIVYRDLREFFGTRQPDLAETREAVLQIRRAKSMVADANDPNAKSAGSFFKNPIVSTEKYDEITNLAKESGIDSVPFFPVDAGKVKIPAAWLIEKAGFGKGFADGCVGLSTKHTLAIVNRGQARAQDVVELKNKIQKAVRDKFAVELFPEPVFVGFK